MRAGISSSGEKRRRFATTTIAKLPLTALCTALLPRIKRRCKSGIFVVAAVLVMVYLKPKFTQIDKALLFY